MLGHDYKSLSHVIVPFVFEHIRFEIYVCVPCEHQWNSFLTHFCHQLLRKPKVVCEWIPIEYIKNCPWGVLHNKFKSR